jgi:Ca2+-dependent lipid-binding protein
VLCGSKLTAQDCDNSSDPYLIIEFGDQTFSTRERYKSKTKEPRFFECFEFNAKLPGVNDILIRVEDHNNLRPDALIGSTVIDLEDR